MAKAKISGITIVKNAVDLDYPFMESIQSILPLVDEMIVSIGDGTDDTEAKIKSIESPKIKIVHSIWNKNLNTGGSVLADETNKCLLHVAKDSDWIFYIQADEVVHEKDYATILKATQQFKDDKKVEGLLFKYIHLYGTYDYIGDSRRWYNHEIRIIRNNPLIQSYRDAQGFRKENKKLSVKKIEANMYHYGWVRHPHATIKKMAVFDTLWGGGDPARNVAENDFFDYMSNADSVEKFNGTHPAIMQKRIDNLNWKVEIDTKKKNFSLKDHLLYKLEKLTGKRLFDYKNYKII